MNINKDQTDHLNLIVSIDINKEDYEPKVNEVLRDYRRKANMPGFRPGKVPEGLVRKMYGKAVLVDEINKLVSESLQNYIKDEQLQVLGEPMPTTSGDDLDWEIGKDFHFDFEMGVAPAIEINLTKDDQITKYQIAVDQDLINKNIENYAARHGQFVNTDSVVDFKEKLTGEIVQLGEDGQPLDGGLSAEDASMILSLIKDEEHKKPFENAKAGDQIVFNLSETFPNDWEIASILKKKNKEEVGDISASLFRYTVREIQKFENAEVNQELFDKVFGEGAVNSVEEFENRIKENIAKDFEESSMAKFGYDAREFLLDKINPPLPEAFLRKWLQSANKEVEQESFDKEFPSFLKGMKWDLISQTIAKQKEIKVEQEEIIEFAKDATRRQFAQYGVSNFPEESLTNYAMSTLKDEKNIHNMVSQIVDRKVVEAVQEIVGVNVQEMPLDDFNKMIYAANDESAVTSEE